MSFFYDLNKKLDSIREKPEVTHKQLNERDEGKPGKNFAKIAKDAGERYGSKAAGERVAGAVRNKLKDQGKLEEEGFPRIQAAIQKYTQTGVNKLAKLGREGASKAKMAATRKEFNQYDNDKVDEDFGYPAGPEYSFSPDTKNYKTPNLDKGRELNRDPYIAAWNKEKVNTTMGPDTRGNQADIGASQLDAQGQMKYVNRTAPGIINKIKDKLGYDMPDPAYGPRPDERERLLKRYPAPTKESAGPAAAKPTPVKPSKSAPKGEHLGTIKGGVWTADPPKPGQKGVPAPSGDPEGVKEAGAPMTAKQRSFAKLAPPKDKITFADKIAGAKKEVDEMLGDVAAEAMRNALSPKQKKIDMNKNGKLDANDFAMLRKGAKPEMDEDNAFDYKSPRQGSPKVGSVERGHKHDIKHTATGRIVTRRTDDQGHSVGADDESDADAAPRGRGRPKGTKNVSSKAKVFQRKSKLMTKESDVDVTDQGEYDQEGDMAKNDIQTIVRHAQALHKVLGDNDNLPEWVQSKLAKIEDMMISVDEYMQNQSDEGDEEPIAEKAVSKQQQKFMGMAHAMQKGEKIKGASKELKKVAKTMKPKDVEDFASTKHKGLPAKVSKKKKEVDENSEEGRLKTTVNSDGTTSTSSTTGRINATIDKSGVSVKPGKSGGVSYGKGIYDSMNRELELMIAESMSVNMSDSTEGGKSLTITATDEDALKLGTLLKNAGLGSGEEMHDHGAEPCETCGSQDCGCGDVQEAVDENAPDWPTNTETSDDALQYAGGLNKPKTDVAGDGQTTIPNTAVHTRDSDLLRRIKEMAGIQNEEHIDLGPPSPEVAAMSKDEVDAALRSGMSPDISGMDPDEVNAQFSQGDNDDQYEESIQRMREMAGIKEAKKPDYLDFDKDGDKKEPMTKALKDKEKKVEESIFTLTNQWRAYKG